jgi:hypothetical protein
MKAPEADIRAIDCARGNWTDQYRKAARLASDEQGRWLEMQAPLPWPMEYGWDTFFVRYDASSHAGPIPVPDHLPGRFGYFSEAALPQPGSPSQIEGFNPTT